VRHHPLAAYASTVTDVSSPVEIAFIGAGGIAIGAILSGLVVAAAQGFRDRKLELRTGRVARHLIENDLETKLFALEALAAKGAGDAPAMDVLSRQDGWDEHVETIAALNDDRWDVIAQAFTLSRNLVATAPGMDAATFKSQVEGLRNIVLSALRELRPDYRDPYPFRGVPGLRPMPAKPSEPG
jgi:hypothetical protein